MNQEEQHIHNLLKEIPIFWINLDRSDRRRNILQTKLDIYNLNHTRISAVDGNNINLEEYKTQYIINAKMNEYEVACTLSHMKTIKYCYEQGLKYALILEDDANFDYFQYKTQPILDLLNECKTLDGECLQLANIVNSKLFSTYNLNNNKLFKHTGACAVAYLITKPGMQKVLDNFENKKLIEVSELMIFGVANNFFTAPYFSYPFLRNNKGEKIDVSTIRLNTKGAHATQTLSKILWDDYYANSNHI
jgi:GR25 family glycosyltransferase involved in LPS biosynthesis